MLHKSREWVTLLRRQCQNDTCLKLLESMVKFRYSFYNEVEFTCFNGCYCNNQRVQLVEL